MFLIVEGCMNSKWFWIVENLSLYIVSFYHIYVMYPDLCGWKVILLGARTNVQTWKCIPVVITLKKENMFRYQLLLWYNIIVILHQACGKNIIHSKWKTLYTDNK